MHTYPNADTVIETLGLTPHVEGGFFKETFRASSDVEPDGRDGARSSMTSIYYMLTNQSPIGHFHCNKSDIMHYFQAGDPLEYSLLHPDGRLETVILGPDVSQGHQPQFVVEGGVWKATRWIDESPYGYGLLGEAVAPGFDFDDMQLANRDALCRMFPQHRALITRMTRPS